MSNGGQFCPRLRIDWKEDAQLLERDAYAWTFFASLNLEVVSVVRGKVKSSGPLPFRVDTGASATVIPQKWVTQGPLTFLRPLLSADPISLTTVAGEGAAYIAKHVDMRFPDDPNQNLYSMDIMICAGLNERGYGLLSLRDILKHFTVEMVGTAPDFDLYGTPLDVPDFLLVPHSYRHQFRYMCPVSGCAVNVLGQSGLVLVCNDHNRRLGML
jgi:hypothetical protein